MDVVPATLMSMAVGDSVGLPLEGLSPRRAARLFPPPHRQRLILGRGMVSDDTEHACMTAQALIASAGEPRPSSGTWRGGCGGGWPAYRRARGWRRRSRSCACG
jgi:ADP-ribosylglycohydrolase